jgi:hypothetical protein
MFIINFLLNTMLDKMKRNTEMKETIFIIVLQLILQFNENQTKKSHA